jgi:A/G-specific adenine glycosylase
MLARPSELSTATAVGQALEAWFASNGRDFRWRRWRDHYRVAITEVLLQRTRAETVDRFIGSFLDRFPDADALASTTTAELELALAPIGLHRRRAASLMALAETMKSEPQLAWDQRPGVGQYVSRAIAVNVDNDPVAMVDSNFVRVLRRVFRGGWMSDYRYDVRLQSLAQAVICGAKDSRSVNWAVLDLGASVCRPGRPRCEDCPIRRQCRTGLSLDDIEAHA